MTISKKERRRRELITVAKSGLIRAGRTFAQAFLASFYGAPLLTHLSPSVIQSALVAGVSAVLALVMRALDVSPIPTPPAG